MSPESQKFHRAPVTKSPSLCSLIKHVVPMKRTINRNAWEIACSKKVKLKINYII